RVAWWRLGQRRRRVGRHRGGGARHRRRRADRAPGDQACRPALNRAERAENAERRPHEEAVAQAIARRRIPTIAATQVAGTWLTTSTLPQCEGHLNPERTGGGDVSGGDRR